MCELRSGDNRPFKKLEALIRVIRLVSYLSNPALPTRAPRCDLSTCAEAEHNVAVPLWHLTGTCLDCSLQRCSMGTYSCCICRVAYMYVVLDLSCISTCQLSVLPCPLPGLRAEEGGAERAGRLLNMPVTSGRDRQRQCNRTSHSELLRS